jgi:hypothetical protein
MKIDRYSDPSHIVNDLVCRFNLSPCSHIDCQCFTTINMCFPVWSGVQLSAGSYRIIENRIQYKRSDYDGLFFIDRAQPSHLRDFKGKNIACICQVFQCPSVDNYWPFPFRIHASIYTYRRYKPAYCSASLS